MPACGSVYSNGAMASGLASPMIGWHRTSQGLAHVPSFIAECDVVLLPKPQAEDVAVRCDGQVLWGWPHCVQGEEITQLAVDRRLTLIAFEAMNYWNSDGSFSLHVFHKNNELAGYCSVLHALELIGTTGDYRPQAPGGRYRLRGYRPGRGDGPQRARRARRAHPDPSWRQRSSVTRSTRRASCTSSTTPTTAAAAMCCATASRVPLSAPFLAEHDIVVNCVLQDPTGH